MIRKNFESRENLDQFSSSASSSTSMIMLFYLQCFCDLPRVQWKYLLFGNCARPKAYFIIWIILSNRLLTANRLVKWRLDHN